VGSYKSAAVISVLAVASMTLHEGTGPLAAEGQHPDAAFCDVKAKPAKLNFTLKDVNGNNVTLADFKGKLIILNFWATWCVPCRAEIPELLELQARYEKDGLQIIGVSVDDPLDKLKPYIAEMKMSYPVLQARGHGDILDAYGPITTVPMSVVVGPSGAICSKHPGMTPTEVFENEIKTLLKL
jgi:peroxiredoxin